MVIDFLGIGNINIWIIYVTYIFLPLLLIYSLARSNRNKHSPIKRAAIIGSSIGWIILVGCVVYGGFIDPVYPQEGEKGLHLLFWAAGLVEVPGYYFLAVLLCD